MYVSRDVMKGREEGRKGGRKEGRKEEKQHSQVTRIRIRPSEILLNRVYGRVLHGMVWHIIDSTPSHPISSPSHFISSHPHLIPIPSITIQKEKKRKEKKKKEHKGKVIPTNPPSTPSSNKTLKPLHSLSLYIYIYIQIRYIGSETPPFDCLFAML